MYQVIDNFLPEDSFLKIKNLMTDAKFEWHLSPWVSNLEEDLKVTSSYYFTHLFFCGFHVDPYWTVFGDFLNKIDCKALIRIKANMYPSTTNIEYQSDHYDYEFPHRGAILYMNTNDGFTIIEDGVEIESVENRVLLFDPSKPHNSTTCTNDKCRVNINFNFF